ncbi:MAG: T9SS type A sorting domain-containing protein [Bacteroidetes bacterium]|nr:T9SS type A sorting domain-containing protein [Bacteroidota bacterium]MCB9043246.1 T9SS type A sorting domain-containing protein [Chitinophagales bacterium]
MACAHDFFPIYECAYDFSVPRIHCYSDDEVSVSLPGVFNTNFSCDYTNVGVFSPIQAEIITLYPTILSENTLYCNNQSAEKGTLSLQNLQGELLFSQQIFVGNNAVPLNPLPQGIYFATFQSASYLYTMKIMLM